MQLSLDKNVLIMEGPQATTSALQGALYPTIDLRQVHTLRRGKGGGRMGSEGIGELPLAALIALIVAIFLIGKQATLGDLAVNASRVSRQLQQVLKGQALKRGTALLLDSNPATRNVTKAALEQQGYRVLMVGSKREALKILEGQPASIALIVTRGKLFDKALIVPGTQILITT